MPRFLSYDQANRKTERMKAAKSRENSMMRICNKKEILEQSICITINWRASGDMLAKGIQQPREYKDGNEISGYCRVILF